VSFTIDDQRRIEAAEGWIGLNSPGEALNELDEITPQHQVHPNVLKLRWQIYTKLEKHDAAFAIAHGLTRILAQDPEAFIWRSYSARRMQRGGLERAMDLLLEVVNTFPDEPILPFNLACYNAQLGKFTEARNWLVIALQVAERSGSLDYWKLEARNDIDLKPLWNAASEIKGHALI
jgi:tetratricopeptide (TPR) repeat protein